MHRSESIFKQACHSLEYKNSFANELSGIYQPTAPSPVAAPELLAWSDAAGKLLGLPAPLSKEEKLAAANIFSGNLILPSMQPIATRYGGHQFGHWAGQLGDGRAILLGQAAARGQSPWEIQLKGAGLTPFSRQGDGRAVLRSSLREFLCSEAMHFLNIPTTRALACVLTGEKVMRDMFYDGHPAPEPGAITTRLAPSFLRFGHFEILAAEQKTEEIRILANYAIDHFFPEFHKSGEKYEYTAWFTEICARTARLLIDWQRVGFVHGVMNTDNLSILGITIDYGPYGWLDTYDPNWTPNTTDLRERRYRYSQQPSIALWNLECLASALLPLAPQAEDWKKSLEQYVEIFQREYPQMLAKKMGISEFRPGDEKIIENLQNIFLQTEIDPTIFYRQLSSTLSENSEQALIQLQMAFYSIPPPQTVLDSLAEWRNSLLQRLGPANLLPAQKLMDSVNPYFLLRNYLVQECIDEIEVGGRDKLQKLQKALLTPYEKNKFTEAFFQKRPDWARNRAGCSMLSCSS